MCRIIWGLNAWGQHGEELVRIRHVLFKIIYRIEKAESKMRNDEPLDKLANGLCSFQTLSDS